MSVTEAPVETTAVTNGEVKVATREEGVRRELLLRAAELIEKRGWAQISTGLLTAGPHCFLGAVYAASGQRWDGIWGYDVLERAARLIGERDARSIYLWNDMIYKDGEAKVLAVMRRMANGASFKDARESLYTFDNQLERIVEVGPLEK